MITQTLKKPVVITAFASKGGDGKTTTICNLAGLLAHFGNKVCILDGDPQASCTQFYLVRDNSNTKHGMTKLLGTGGVSFDNSYIAQTTIDGLDIVVSDFPAREGGVVLSQFSERDDAPVCFINVVKSAALSSYDYVLIDTQGAVGKLQRSALYAADIALSPFQPTQLDVGELLAGTIPMVEKMGLTCQAMGLNVPQLWVLGSRVPSTANAKFWLDTVRDGLASSITVRVLNTQIKDSTHYQKALDAHQPVHTIDRQASINMHALLAEMLPEYSGRHCDDWKRELKSKKSTVLNTPAVSVEASV